MSHRGIVDKIEEEAARECGQLLANAKEEASRMEKEAKEEAAKLKEEHGEIIKNSLEENRRKVASSASLEGRLMAEKSKRALLDEAFSAAGRLVSSVGDAEFKKFASRCAQNIPKGAKGKLAAPQKRLKAAKQALVGAGLSVKEAEEGNMSDGFVFYGDDFEYNFSLERLIEEERGKSESEIAALLFS